MWEQTTEEANYLCALWCSRDKYPPREPLESPPAWTHPHQMLTSSSAAPRAQGGMLMAALAASRGESSFHRNTGRRMKQHIGGEHSLMEHFGEKCPALVKRLDRILSSMGTHGSKAVVRPPNKHCTCGEAQVWSL